MTMGSPKGLMTMMVLGSSVPSLPSPIQYYASSLYECLPARSPLAQ